MDGALSALHRDRRRPTAAGCCSTPATACSRRSAPTQAREDDAERAVRAGLAICSPKARAAGRRGRARGIGHDGFDVRVGIHTGPVLLGGGVDAEGSIRGITVNIAARMEQSAPRRRRCASATTPTATCAACSTSSAQPPLAVKGIDAPLRDLSRAARQAARVSRRRRAASRASKRRWSAATPSSRAVQRRSTRLCASAALRARDASSARPGSARAGCCAEFQTLARVAAAARAGCCSAAPQPHGALQPYGLLRDMLAWRFADRRQRPRRVARRKLSDGLAPLFARRRRRAAGAPARPADRPGLRRPARISRHRSTTARQMRDRALPGARRATAAPLRARATARRW